MDSNVKNAAVLYLKSESVEQPTGESLNEQERHCREYCSLQGWPIEAVFADSALGASVLNSPEFRRLLAYCKCQKDSVRYLVVRDLARLGGTLIEQAHALRVLTCLGVSVRSVYDADFDVSPMGRVEAKIIDAFRQFRADN